MNNYWYRTILYKENKILVMCDPVSFYLTRDVHGKCDLGSFDQSVPITTDVVSSNLDQGEVYNIM